MIFYFLSNTRVPVAVLLTGLVIHSHSMLKTMSHQNEIIRTNRPFSATIFVIASIKSMISIFSSKIWPPAQNQLLTLDSPDELPQT